MHWFESQHCDFCILTKHATRLPRLVSSELYTLYSRAFDCPQIREIPDIADARERRVDFFRIPVETKLTFAILVAL